MSNISEYFNGKCFLITGGTGFIGKQIIEKLLRSSQDIDHIYLIVRPKKNLTIEQRIDSLYSLPLFDQVRLLKPNSRFKLIPLNGDLTKVKFDLSNKDEQTIINHCHIVIHSGASVRFNQSLKESIQANVCSIQYLIDLCNQMKQLQSIVHISTAYIHCYRFDIDEKIYSMDEDPQLILESFDNIDEHIFNQLSEKILLKYPNTYTYTKSLAEYFILLKGNHLPFAIIRPSIVGATWKEPIPESGWIDSYSGTTSIIVSIGKCLLRVISARPHVDHPMIPVDTVANMTLAIAWFTALNYQTSSKLIVYNCCSGTRNQTCLSNQDFVQKVVTEQKAIPFQNYTIIQPSAIPTMNTYSYYSRRLFGELLPAYLMDLVALLTFRKAKMIKICRKVTNVKSAVEYFCQNQWIFAHGNSQLLENEMNQIDREIFNFNLTQLNWSSYLRNYSIGIQKYLLKEESSQSSSSSSKHSFINLKNLLRLILIILLIFIRKFLWNKFKIRFQTR